MPTNKEEIAFLPSTIETIDTGFFEHVDKIFNIQTNTNTGWKKVPTLWLGTERTFQVKNNADIRDKSGRLKLPLITVERTSMSKDPTFKGAHQAYAPEDSEGARGYRGRTYRVSKRIVQSKTRKFAGEAAMDTHGQRHFPSTNSKVVYEELLIPSPTYVTIMYSITLRSEYQQQINDMVIPFVTRTGQLNHFVFKKDNHRYEAFIQQEFGQTNNLANLGEEDRSFQTKIEVKVLGYLMGGDKNDPRPKIVRRENVVEVKLIRERVILGDKKPWLTDDSDYRE